MRLGVDTANGLTKKGKLALWIDDVKRQCLIELIWGNPSIQMPVSQETLDIMNAVRMKLKLHSIHWYVLDLDVLSNTVTVSPPIMDEATGRISFDYQLYDERIKREGWPVFVVEVSPLWAFGLSSPKTLNALHKTVAVENPNPSVVEVSG